MAKTSVQQRPAITSRNDLSSTGREESEQGKMLNLGTPEDFLTVPADMPAGYPVDAINCALSRADAVLSMISSQFDGTGGDRYADHIIANALWAVEGEIRLLKTLVDHGWRTEREASQ